MINFMAQVDNITEQSYKIYRFYKGLLLWKN